MKTPRMPSERAYAELTLMEVQVMVEHLKTQDPYRICQPQLTLIQMKLAEARDLLRNLPPVASRSYNFRTPQEDPTPHIPPYSDT